MNADSLASFYSASGRKVIHTESGYWYSASPLIYHSVPTTEARDPSESELRTLFREHRLAGVQFPNLRQSGLPSARYMVRDKDYNLHSLQRQFRQHVLKGFAECEVRDIGFDYLYREGMAVNLDALTRRDYRVPYFAKPARWRAFCDAGRATPGAGVMASFVRGDLAAYLVYFIVEVTCYGLHMVSQPSLWDHQPNHLLYFNFTRAMMERPEIKAVSLGLQSLPAPRKIDQFKRHAGYAEETCYISVVLRPMAQFLLQNRGTVKALNTFTRMTGNHHLQRAHHVVMMANRTAPRTL